MPPRKKADDVKDAIDRIANRTKDKGKGKPDPDLVDQVPEKSEEQIADQAEEIEPGPLASYPDKGGPVTYEDEGPLPAGPIEEVTEFVTVAKLATLTVPLGPVYDDEYVGTHVDCRLPEKSRGLALDRLWRGLEAANAKLANGRPITGRPDVIRWICDQIASAHPYEPEPRPTPAGMLIGAVDPEGTKSTAGTGRTNEPEEPEENKN